MSSNGSDAEPAGASSAGPSAAPGLVAASTGEPFAAPSGLIHNGEQASSSGGVAGEPTTGLASPTLSAQIEALRKEQHELRTAKKHLSQELRNAQRKKKRLCDRARQLTDGDLLHVLTMRKEARDRSSEQSRGSGNAASSTDGGVENSGAPNGHAADPST